MIGLTEAFARAEAAFPASDNYGVEIGRHPGGFYNATIMRACGDDDARRFAILAYRTGESPVEALTLAVAAAEKARADRKDWLGEALPDFDQAEAA